MQAGFEQITNDSIEVYGAGLEHFNSSYYAYESAYEESLRDFAGVTTASAGAAGSNRAYSAMQSLYNTTIYNRDVSSALRAQDNYYRSERYRIGNAQAASDFNAIGESGFNVDLNDDATRAFFAAGQAAKTNNELQLAALGIIAGATALPLLAADAVAVGSLAIRGGAALSRGISATITNFGQSVGAYGVRGSLLRAGYPRNFLQVQLASRAAATSVRNGASFVAGSPAAAVNSGLTRVANMVQPAMNAAGRVIANPNVQAGLLSGSTNALVDYGINGDNSDVLRSFASGFIGGSTGNFIGSFSSHSQPLISGLAGGAIGEFADQLLGGEQFNGYDIALSGLLGGTATYGANKLLGVYAPNTPIVIPQRVVVRTLVAGVLSGISSSSANATTPFDFKF